MRSLLLFLSFLIYASSGFCQNKEREKAVQQFPIMIAFSAHSYSWPIVKSFITPIQPGFILGTEYIYSTKRNHSVLQSFNLGYFHNPEFLNAYYVNSFFTYRYNTPVCLFFDAAIGAGYFHRRHAREVYKLNESGVYVRKTDWGSPGVQLCLNLGAGYSFLVHNRQLSIFFNYEWFINYPHAKDHVPFLPHSLYSLGIRYYPFK